MMSYLNSIDARIFRQIYGLPRKGFVYLCMLVIHYIALGNIVYGFIIAGIFLIPAYQKGAIFVGGCVFLAALVNDYILQDFIARARPFKVLSGVHISVRHLWKLGYSFPSGHATIAWACAVSLFLAVSPTVGVVLMLFAVLVCFSRVYFGFHYPSDVIAGAFFGASMGAGLFYLVHAFTSFLKI